MRAGSPCFGSRRREEADRRQGEWSPLSAFSRRRLRGGFPGLPGSFPRARPDFCFYENNHHLISDPFDGHLDAGPHHESLVLSSFTTKPTSW